MDAGSLGRFVKNSRKVGHVLSCFAGAMLKEKGSRGLLGV